ncbi:MAG: methyltransferase domain-containing protein [Acidimicrobiales bacterium]
MSGVQLPVAPGEPADVKSCCGDLWSHPAVQLLAGDAFRPGGTSLTARLVESLELAPDSTALDIGSGTGATLRWLAGAGMTPFGIDVSAGLAAEAASTAAGPVGRADAERLPFVTASFDLVLAECVMSVFPDKRTALAEIRRVLRPGGHLVMSDVVVAGPLPPELDSLLGWIACASGALSTQGWAGLLAEAGFIVATPGDHRRDVADLVAQARRRLAMLQGAVAAGIVPPGLELAPLPGIDLVMPDVASLPIGDALKLGQDVLGRVSAAIDDGTIGYVSLLAESS